MSIHDPSFIPYNIRVKKRIKSNLHCKLTNIIPEANVNNSITMHLSVASNSASKIKYLCEFQIQVKLFDPVLNAENLYPGASSSVTELSKTTIAHCHHLN